ncbi:LuxR C-terminal-related transcriptional regulator [Patescibacteria group bacterium]|nr:LuxR C-terminal-related transcriptional regulator [Patescibacteria group bacterium]
MLRKLTPRHKDIVRRTALGEKTQEIAEDLKMAQKTIQTLLREPLALEYLGYVESKMEETMANRMDVMDKINLAANTAADFCIDAMGGKVKYGDGTEEKVPISMRLKSAWDLLDRNGNMAMKRLAVDLNYGDEIVAAYKEKHE